MIRLTETARFEVATFGHQTFGTKRVSSHSDAQATGFVPGQDRYISTHCGPADYIIRLMIFSACFLLGSAVRADGRLRTLVSSQPEPHDVEASLLVDLLLHELETTPRVKRSTNRVLLEHLDF